MSIKFNINRPPVTEEEIKQNQNFDLLLKQFKNASIKKAREDQTWWKNKKTIYRAVIGGVGVACTITLISILNSNTKAKHNDKITTKKETTTTQKSTTSFINAPSPTLKPQATKYKIDAQKGGEIVVNKSKIVIPKNAFVNKKGVSITGEVTIEYNEFHHPVDIMLSGIPMLYDSATIKSNFESAGMFQINGTQNGENLAIHPEKSLEVKMASFNSEDKFNQYYLDTNSRNWVYLKKDIIVPLKVDEQKTSTNNTSTSNEKIKDLRKKIEITIPAKIDSVAKYYTSKSKALPLVPQPLKPAKATGRPTFKLDGNYDEFPELKAFDNLIFEVGDENSNYNKSFHEITWSDVKVTEGPLKGKNYVLNLIYRSKREKLIVYPVLSGNDLIKAESMYAAKMKEYEMQLQKRTDKENKLLAEMQAKQAEYIAQKTSAEFALKKEQEELQLRARQRQESNLNESFGDLGAQQKVQRIFQIKNFGIYNSDCPHLVALENATKPIFLLNGKPFTTPNIYVINFTDNRVIQLDRANGYATNLLEGKNYVFCLFTSNTLFYCDKETVSQSLSSASNKFEVLERTDALSSPTDLRKLIEG